MILLKPNELDSVIEIEVDGKITEHDIETFESIFKDKKENNERLNLLIQITNMQGYTMKGLVEDLKFAKHWNDFDKIAVVSDKKAIELGTKVSDYMPKIEVKHFNTDEKDSAKEWLN